LEVTVFTSGRASTSVYVIKAQCSQCWGEIFR